MWRRSAVAVLSLTAAVGPAQADPVDDYLQAAIRDHRIPGLALAIVRDGKVVKTAAYGKASLELDVPATPETVFEIGSVTKQFTSAAIMMLVEDGKLSLDEPISVYLAPVPEPWSVVTVRHLLTHTSGIRDYLGVPSVANAFHTDISHAEVAALLANLPMEFTPGETWAYSNSGYLLLGNIIEKASGKTYWQFLRERIFTPLGMAKTRSTAPRAVIPGRASGYEWRNGAFENRRPLGEDAYAAGAIVSTVGDLARWDAALRGTKLLSRASLKETWTAATVSEGAVAPFDYGFGWFVGAQRGRRYTAHTGGTPGFSSAIYRFLDDGLTVILLGNHGDRVLDHLVLDVAAMTVPALAPPPPPATDPDPAMTARLRSALEGAIARKPALVELFTPPMQRFLQTAVGREAFPWAAADGAIKSFTYVESEDDARGRILRYRVMLGDSPRWYSFQLAPDGKVAQMRWW